MKKIIKTLLSLVCVIILSLSISSCVSKTTVEPTEVNDVAKNAYVIAVEEGYDGTFTEWIISLLTSGEYESIYDLAVAAGVYTGSLEDFINDLKGDTGSTSLVDASSYALTSIVSVYCSFNQKTTGTTIFGKETTSTEKVSVTGSGVIYDIVTDDNGVSDGTAYIITNYHVVYDKDSTPLISDEIYVFLYGMEYEKFKIEATYIGGSMQYDIAVLKIQSDYLKSDSGYPYHEVTVGDSSKLVAGSSVIAVGNARGKGISVTNGIISVPNDNISMTLADEATSATIRVIRNDALINAGNSGGGLFDSEGILIGITNAKNVQENTEGLCYAIPINIAKAVANQIIKKCNGDTITSIERVYLGVMVEVMESAATINSDGNLEIRQKIQVQEVSNGGDSVGKLAVGDELKYVTYNGETYPVINLNSVEDVLLNVSVGESVTVGFIRDNQTSEVIITFTSGTSI